MPHRLLILVVWCIWVAAVPLSQAFEYETVAVVTAAGIDTLADDLAFLGGMIQNPRMGENLGTALARHSRVKALAGLDPARRLAVALRTDGIDLAPLVLLPVTDAQALLQSLQPVLGDVEGQEPGLWKIGRDSLTGFVRESGGWAFVAQSADRLDDLPDPEAILRETPADAWLAMTWHVRRLPNAYRTMAIDNLRSRLRLAAEQHGGLSLAAGALDGDVNSQAWQLIEQGLSDAEQIRLAFRLDHEARHLTVELRVLPLADSPLAKSVQTWDSEARRWSELEKGQAWRSRIDLRIDDVTRTRWNERIRLGSATASQAGAGEANPPSATNHSRLHRWLTDVATATLAPSHCQVELAIVGDRPPLSCAVKCTVMDTATTDRLVRAFREIAKERPAAKGRDGEPGNDRQPQDISVCILSAEELPKPLDQLIGDEPPLLVAARGEAIVLAAGAHADKAMRELSDPQPPSGPLALVVRSGTAATVLSQVAKDDGARTVGAVAALNLRSADDRLSLLVTRDGDELVVRATAHEGVLRTTAVTIGIGILQAMSATPRSIP